MPGSISGAARTCAIVGPYLSGKSALTEALLESCGSRTGPASLKNSGPKSGRDHLLGIDTAMYHGNYLGDSWTFLDCPGSVEFAEDARAALMVADIAVVVCDPVIEKAQALTPLLHFLDDQHIPHLLFVNKMDSAPDSLHELMEALQAASGRPLVLRQIPISEQGGKQGSHITGYVDLVSERAYAYQEGKPSKLVPMPVTAKDLEERARRNMLETLADFDDMLLEKLLDELRPSTNEIFADFAKDVANDLVVPVLLGAAEHLNGVERLLKALRHDAPLPDSTCTRLNIPLGPVAARVFKTVFVPHMGKVSHVRLFKGTLKDGQPLGNLRISGMYRMTGLVPEKITEAGPGEVIALGRLDGVRTGDLLTGAGIAAVKPGSPLDWPQPQKPVYAVAIHPDRREDEVKLSSSLAKIAEEDPSLIVETDKETHEFLLWGQGEIHLKAALEKLTRLYNVAIHVTEPRVAYRETIQKSINQHARHKKQSGGHGEFGDIHITIKPLPRGKGFQFDNSVTGGAVPKQYIPAVEAGVRDCLAQGPLGFPLVDIAVTLTDGQFHAVDSSDMAFRRAAILAMKDGLPQCQPILLEPIYDVKISVPTNFTSNAQTILSRRRGQILGFDQKPAWPGWDEITALLPQAEMGDLIIELRSQTQGAGTYDWSFAHLAELAGRLADEAVSRQKAATE
jgi:elongation factor G